MGEISKATLFRYEISSAGGPEATDGPEEPQSGTASDLADATPTSSQPSIKTERRKTHDPISALRPGAHTERSTGQTVSPEDVEAGLSGVAGQRQVLGEIKKAAVAADLLAKALVRLTTGSTP